MEPDRLSRIESLYHAALTRASDDRTDWLSQSCAGDDDLRRDVESLLAHADTDAEQLFAPVADLAATVFAARLTPGERLGPYAIVEFLGAGGMGEVYRAHDPRLERDVAIKVLPAAEFDPDRQRRLLSEARSAGALNHPNILTVYDVGVYGDSPFVVSELLVGETLRHALERGPLPPLVAIDLLIDTARGCAAAHDHGIVHRDLKPENLFVTRDGRLKILDFGLARQTSGAVPNGPGEPAPASATHEDLAAASTGLGTVGYMSPEQVRGEPVDRRADIFALGAILFEAATGRRALDGRSDAQSIEAVLRVEPPALMPSAARAVPATVESVARRCLAKNPSDRFSSAHEVVDQLQRVRAGVVAPRRPRAGRVALPLLAVCTGAAVVVVLAGPWRRAAPVTSTVKAIAVLPLKSQGPDGEYLADGLTDALISDLARLSGVRVISRTSSMTYKTTGKPLPQIALELGVDAIVEGAVTQAQGLVRVTAQLVDARTDRLMWSHTYEQAAQDVLRLEAEVARAIAGEIRATISPALQARLTAAKVIAPEAHEAYLQGRFFLAKGGESDLRRAIADFTRATALDPAFAAAYAGLADAYTAQRSVYLSPHAVMPKAREAATRALELDPMLAEAHVSMGGVLMYYDFDWPGAKREFTRAIELGPNLAAAHDAYALYLASIGRAAEARREAAVARSLDPLSLNIMVDSGWVHYLAREYDGTVRENSHALDLEPNFWPALRDLGLGYEKIGRLSDAIRSLERALQIDHNSTIFEMLGGAYAAAGQTARARQVLSELSAQASERYVCPYEVATIHACLGDTAAAINWLERGLEQRADCMPWAAADPKLDGLHADARFQRVLSRLGLPRR